MREGKRKKVSLLFCHVDAPALRYYRRGKQEDVHGIQCFVQDTTNPRQHHRSLVLVFAFHWFFACHLICSNSSSYMLICSPNSVQAPVGIFGVPLEVSIKYANVAISLTNEQGESYVYGYVPIVIAKCGVFLKEKGKKIVYTFPVLPLILRFGFSYGRRGYLSP